MVRYLTLLVLSLWILSCGGNPQTGDTRIAFKEGELLVKFKAGLNDMQKASAHRVAGTSVLKRLKIDHIERISLPVGISVEEGMRRYKDNPNVEFVEPNYIVRAAEVPNDTRFREQWYLQNIGQRVNGISGTPGADIAAPDAWSISQGSSSVRIAIIDSGVDKHHPDLSENLLDGYDFVDEDTDPNDLNGHGTHVAGIIGAVSNNARGIAGINWRAGIMPVRALDQNGEGTIADVIEAIGFAADHGATIVNMSLSGPNYSQALYNSIRAYPDILFVVASGNDGRSAAGGNNDLTPRYPASFDLPNIISVAASDRNDNVSIFSNYGQISVDLAAPGEGILSTIPSFITGVTYYGPYRVVYLSFGFEGINGAGSRNDVMQRAIHFVSGSSIPSILLVDDDGGSLYERFYLTALQALGYSADSYQVSRNADGPPSDVLSRYGLVIWFTGDEQWNTITPTDQQNLKSYLDSSGSLLITGQEIGYDIGHSDFYHTYLHARYVTDSVHGNILSGSNFFDGLSVDVSRTNGDGAANQLFVDAIFPLGSTAAFSVHYDNAYAPFDGTSMAAAVVSGVAGLVASYYGNYKSRDLKSVILNSVDFRQSMQGKTLTGGRINAYRAVSALLPPSDLAASPQAGGKVLLTWTDKSAAEQGFVIERKRPGDRFREIASVPGGVTAYTDGGLEATTFIYRVRGFIDQTSSSYSNEVSISIQNGAKSGGGGGGGCSVGTVAHPETAAADACMIFLPVIVVWIVRWRISRGSKDSLLRVARGNRGLSWFKSNNPKSVDIISPWEMR